MKNKGFTLIELMVVVVIIGILAAIAIPNFISMQKRAKEASVKNNMHTLQLAAEDFSTLTEGIYAYDCGVQVGAITLNAADVRSIAGTDNWGALAAVANILLPTSFKNPVLAAAAAPAGYSPAAAVYAAADAGAVYYASLDVAGAQAVDQNAVISYSIGGNGVDAVLALVLTSGQ
ncbi:prepilin-type N-terminal cleavage/methylation domain-containing protein [candidate division WOR-3 bacterium]|nr:prepilin-type N-terminal cleavage/methylation domain-containing protein [candidate division WOR-3 bacterium]